MNSSKYFIRQHSEKVFAVERKDLIPMKFWDNTNPPYELFFSTHVKAFLAIMTMINNEDDFEISWDTYSERNM